MDDPGITAINVSKFYLPIPRAPSPPPPSCGPKKLLGPKNLCRIFSIEPLLYFPTKSHRVMASALVNRALPSYLSLFLSWTYSHEVYLHIIARLILRKYERLIQNFFFMPLWRYDNQRNKMNSSSCPATSFFLCILYIMWLHQQYNITYIFVLFLALC